MDRLLPEAGEFLFVPKRQVFGMVIDAHPSLFSGSSDAIDVLLMLHPDDEPRDWLFIANLEPDEYEIE